MGVRIVGSVLAGICLAAALVLCAPFVATGKEPVPAVETIRIGGSGGLLETMRSLGEAFRRSEPGCRVVVYPSLGSGGGIKAVIAGKLDVGVSTRPVTSQERSRGVESTPVCRSAMVFVVSGDNPPAGVSTRQLLDIYAGWTTRWPDGTPIRLVLRPEDDSDMVLLMAASPAMKSALRAALAREGMIVATTDQAAATAIETVPGTLGMSVLPLVLSEKRRFMALPLDGVTPDARSISNGSWPLVKTFYSVTGPKPSPATRRFLKFLASPEARAVFRRLGCVSAG